MTNCYWKERDGKKEPHCDHLAVNGKCYREENRLAEDKKVTPCFYQQERTDAEIEAHEAMVDYKMRKMRLKLNPCKPFWIRIAFGLYQCSECNYDFPGAVREKGKCPHCGAIMRGERNDCRRSG